MQLHALIRILQPTYAVRVAKDGEKGLEIAHKYDVDLILLDMIMPGLSGLAVLKALKASKKTKDIPVILATGNTSQKDIEESRAMGVTSYIQKPFEHKKVMQSVRQILE
jgi:CheY-like chemotaxis protein